jgi:putative zinc finger protein
MCNQERLLDYLYDELPAAERMAFEVHLHGCAACRAELAALGGTRQALALWSPPDPELGFRIVRNEAPVPRRSFWSFAPAWGLAAAAVLLLSIGAAIANLEVRYGSDGVVVRTGWGGTAPAAPVASTNEAAAVPVAATSELKERLVLLDARLQQLERDRKVSAASLPEPTSAGTQMSDAEILREVRKIIAESETKQQRELALRVTQVVRDVDAARAGDLARVEQGLRQIQGLTDAELIQHRRELNLLRVTQQRQR